MLSLPRVDDARITGSWLHSWLSWAKSTRQVYERAGTKPLSRRQDWDRPNTIMGSAFSSRICAI